MQIPDTITKHPSILASVLARADGSSLITAGAETWHPLLQAALPLMALTSAGFVRVVAGDNTIIVQRELDRLIGVVIATGDPVAKSLHRMIRRVLVPPGKRGAKPRLRPASGSVVVGGGL